MPVTDPAARLAALDDAALLTLHKRLDDTSTAEDPAAVEAHHLVTVEMLKRGIDHGHDGDAWANAVILVDEVVVKSVDEIDIPEGMGPALEEVLVDGGTVTVLLTADGYVMKAEGEPAGGTGPTVNAVHVDAIMGAYPIRRRKRKKAPAATTEAPEVEKAEGYDVPEDVQSAAKRALQWISDGRAGDGFTSVGRNRARQLADGGPVGRDTLVKMRAYFARHAVDKQADDWGDKSDPTPGMVAWYAWGGDPGRTWANRMLAGMEKAYDPESALTPKQKALYDAYEMVAEQYGEFTLDEAHYMAADDNPFQDRGMACANCVFYDGGGGCEILAEQVEAMGLCKLWVIPDDLLGVDDEELLQTMDAEDLAGFAAYSWLDDEDDMEKAGNPEPLRDYWRSGGKGKINWGAGGDFTACVAAVSKYMTSEEAKGYCAIRHREVNGFWPGDKRNRPAKKAAVFGGGGASTFTSATTFTLPDGAVYTVNWSPDVMKRQEPVLKHPGHGDQKVHAGGRGGSSASGGSNSARGAESYGGYQLNPVDNPPATGRPDNVVAAARGARAKAAAAEPQITRDMIDVANANGGEMEGLDFRLKSEKSLARKIDDEKAELGGDVEATAGKMSDVARYTMTFADDGYAGSVKTTIADLEAKGYQVRVKNYWQKGDPYQGINVAAVHPSGQKFELQFHTKASLGAKEPIHTHYETYRESRNNRTRWTAYYRMTRMAAKIPVPPGVPGDIGEVLFQGFQTAEQAGLG